MKILLLNQTFYPDVVSTAQHLSDLAVALAERGHEVTVVAGRRAYDSPGKRFPGSEKWRGISILRVASLGLGKGAKWRRALDFASFILSCCWRLLWLPRQDAVVALTSPPLISFIGAWFARLKGGRFFYWVMDMNPDEAIAAGWLRADSLVAQVLGWMSRFSLSRAEKVIALDQYMKALVEAKGIAPEKISVIPPWSHDAAARFDEAGRDEFRRKHGLEGKFVVMYSGNHSPCHPLDTLMAAARKMAADDGFVFLFVGGGSEQARVKRFAEDHRLENVVCLPYQPLERLAGSLSAADLQVVVMGELFVGMIHPCKIYNILSMRAPVLYIGPRVSHIAGILGDLASSVCAWIEHGDAVGCVAEIRRVAQLRARGEEAVYARVSEQYSEQALLTKLIAELERTV